MMRRNREITLKRVLAVVAVLALTVMLIAGCTPSKAATGGSTPAQSTASKPAMSKPASGMAMASDDAPDPTVQKCVVCSGGKQPAGSTGTVETSGGKQIVRVSIKGGTYTPNMFTAKTGMPVQVVFTVDGKPAKGCVATPTFKSLNKKVNVTTGSQSLDLGTLAPGTYQFTCAMGMNMGRIVVQ